MCDNNLEIEDRILLKKAAREGCSESFTAIYIKYQSMVCDFLRKLGADHIAEDICQSVFMEIHEGRCKYNGSSEVKSFLFGIATNIYKNKLKINKKEAYELQNLNIVGGLLIRESSNSNQLKFLETAEQANLVKNMIAKLPPKSRQVIELVYLKGKTRQQAAEILNSDYFSVCSSIRYGKNWLRDKFFGITKLLLLLTL